MSCGFIQGFGGGLIRCTTTWKEPWGTAAGSTSRVVISLQEGELHVERVKYSKEFSGRSIKLSIKVDFSTGV